MSSFGSSASTNWILSSGVAMAFPTLSGPSSWIIDLFTKFWILLPSCHNGFKWKQVTHCSSCRMLVYLPFLTQKGINKSLLVLLLLLLLLYDCRLQAWVFLHLGCERLGGKREKIRQSWNLNPVTMITSHIQSALPNFMYLLVCPPVAPQGEWNIWPLSTGCLPSTLPWVGHVYQLNHQVCFCPEI